MMPRQVITTAIVTLRTAKMGSFWNDARLVHQKVEETRVAEMRMSGGILERGSVGLPMCNVLLMHELKALWIEGKYVCMLGDYLIPACVLEEIGGGLPQILPGNGMGVNRIDEETA